MICSYNFEIPVDPIALMKMVKQVVVQSGGFVEGEIPNVSVRFTTVIGDVAGKCRLVEGSIVNIEVTQKPDVVTCTMVREKLVYYITEAVKMYSQQTKAARQMERQAVV
jgi:hypothetical protein